MHQTPATSRPRGRDGTTYRPDIDGIRAVAVGAVILFHLQLPWIQGGYVGVDVFFVLSGFLITGIIRRGALAGTFSFSRFYLRRIRRLIPSLVATVLATTVAAAFLLLPDDMIGFARSAVASLFSVSNVVFFAESGYWDSSSDLKPLLHTWSLGVEEQFYLLWPALVVVLVKLRARFAVALGVLSVVAFLAALWMFAVNPSAAFYLSPFRVFQFGLGALVGVLPLAGWRALRSPLVRDLLLVAGLALIAYACLAYTAETPFPGWRALPPTLGAMLLLAAGAGNGSGVLGRLVLENPVSVWLGRVSYALYLAHWPVIALYRYRTGLDLTVLEQLLLAALTVAGGAALHYGVERRFYQRHSDAENAHRRLTDGRFAARTAAISVTAGLVLTTAWLGSGWMWRYPDLPLTPEQIEAGMKDRFTHNATACRIEALDSPRCRPDRPIQVLVLGNSHEPDGYNFLRGGLRGDRRVELVSFGSTNRCGTLSPRGDWWASSEAECQHRLDELADKAGTFDAVLYAANIPFAPNKEQFAGMLRSLKELNPDVRILTLGGYLNTARPCSLLFNLTGSTRACADPDNVSYFEDTPYGQPWSEEILALTDVYVDRVGLLCPGRELSRCRTQSDDGAPMFYDEHHHSLAFATEAGAAYFERHPDVLEPDGPRGGFGLP